MGAVKPKMDPQEFWNRRSKTFPRYSPEEGGFEVGMLSLARGNGAVFKGARIVDVGCGAGLYTIRLAMEAERVTALDISDGMLGVLKGDAERLGISNIDYVNSDWLDFDLPAGTGLLFCSMTPALASDEGREKAASAPGAQVVFIGWNGARRSDVVETILERYGAGPADFPNSARQTRLWLEGRGIRHEGFPVEGEWRVPFSGGDLLENCLDTLANLGVEADQSIRNF